VSVDMSAYRTTRAASRSSAIFSSVLVVGLRSGAILDSQPAHAVDSTTLRGCGNRQVGSLSMVADSLVALTLRMVCRL